MRNIALILFMLVSFVCQAQTKRQHPIDDKPFLKVFAAAERHLSKDTLQAALHIQTLDSLCNASKDEYPLYVGIIRLWQSWYQLASTKLPTECKQKAEGYMQFALQQMKGNEKMVLDSFSLDMLNLGSSFKDIGQLQLLSSFDSLWRKGTNYKYRTSLGDYSITLYAWYCYNKQETATAYNLAKYDALFFKDINEKSGNDDKLAQVCFKAITLGKVYTDWKVNKDSATGAYLFRQYKTWCIKSELWLNKTLLKENLPGKPGFNYGNRSSYISLYNSLLVPYAEFTRFYNSVGNAAIYLNRFTKEVLLPEIDSAMKWEKPIATYPIAELVNCTFQLSAIYYDIGEYRRGNNTLRVVAQKLEKVAGWKDSLYKKSDFYTQYYLTAARLYYARKNFSLGDDFISAVKPYMTAPTVRNNDSYNNWWENYVLTRCIELDGLFSSGRVEAAIDSVLNYYAVIYNNDSGSYPAKKYEALFLHNLCKVLIKKQRWQMAYLVSSDALRSINPSSAFDMGYYYPIVAQHILSNTLSSKALFGRELLQTLLKYTAEQLSKNLPSLSPDQRIIFYENKLLPFFNFYHTLVFDGYLKNDPLLKEQVALQSINLKRLLTSNDEALVKKYTGTKYEQLANSILDANRKSIRLEGQVALNGESWMSETMDIIKDNTFENYNRLMDDDENNAATINFIPFDSIRSKLSNTDTYIEFIRYNNLTRHDSVSYGAFILQKGSKQLLTIELFTESQLTTLMKRKEASPQLKSLDFVGQRGVTIKNKTKDSTGVVSTNHSGKDELAMLVMDSLSKHIPINGRLLFIPDGYLNRISFAALKYKGKFLFQHYQLKQMSSIQALLKEYTRNDSTKWLLAGGLDYKENCNTGGQFLNSNISWNYLPGSLKEVQLLNSANSSKVQQIKLVTGTDFLDSTLNKNRNYPYIHIASHGFYFDSSEVDTYFSDDYLHFSLKQYPLLRSGIVVSTANCPTTKNSLSENGYLSGYEIAATDLSRCRLMVLSACESALGDIKSNLGVMGIQRALKLAGVQQMLITLWKIPDAETVEFMQHFYQHFWNGKTAEQALSLTQETMSSKYDVSKWGAFVLIE